MSDRSTELVARDYAGVRAILADGRFEVAEAEPSDEVGTVAWLRASVSRFSNGAAHADRRTRVAAELDRLDPLALRSAATTAARVVLAAAPGGPDAAIAAAARDVPTAVLAGRLTDAPPEQVVAAVAAVAAAYFPGADAPTRRRADVATTELLRILSAPDLDTAVARIALLVQGFDATAALIRAAVDARAEWGERSSEAIVTEVLRFDPPVSAIRRVAATDVELAGLSAAVGDPVVCDVRTANRDPSTFERPDEFVPELDRAASLTFGSGVRPCPGQPQARALAVGVLDAIRTPGG
jgi:cytochrome P450